MFVEEEKNKKKNKYLKAVETGLTQSTPLGPSLQNQVEEVMTKFQDNVIYDDKMSYFRMEYCLYCLRELQRLDEDSRFLKEDISDLLRQIQKKDDQVNRLRYNYSRSTYQEKRELENIEKEAKKLREKMSIFEVQIEAKNSIIKRLIAHILQWRVKAKPFLDSEHYSIPLNTFWLPLDMLENIDRNYFDEDYRLDLVEYTKKKIIEDQVGPRNPKNLAKAVDDKVVDYKYSRTYLGYDDRVDENEELVFAKLEPLAEKTSNQILDIIPDKIRDTFNMNSLSYINI